MHLRQEVIVGPSLSAAFVLTVAGRSGFGDAEYAGRGFRECCGGVVQEFRALPMFE